MSQTSPQQIAASPYSHIWVSASAGTGKTKVLVDRLVNLLLLGFKPQTLLCLTFTNTAAAEMQERVRHKLKSWALCSEEELLKDLKERGFREKDLPKARSLFMDLLDAPYGLTIQTIHSFCHTLLRRFSQESDLSSFFKAMDDIQSKELWKKACDEALADPEMVTAIYRLADDLSEKRLFDLLGAFHSQPILQSPEEIGEVFRQRVDAVLSKPLGNVGYLKESLLSMIPEEEETWREAVIQEDEAFFFTAKREVRKKLWSTSFIKKNHDSQDLLEQYLQTLEYKIYDETHQNVLGRTLAFLQLAQKAYDLYAKAKQKEGLIDFHDLIQKARLLLQTPGIAEEILIRLDGGIEHILVDEAQDTSAQQWLVILALIEAFITPDNPHRTLFVVGDIKQSIYGFQGASPELFQILPQRLQGYFEGTATPLKQIALNLSFRTVPAVLDLVDEVFKDREGFEGVFHDSHRKQHCGRVQLWPLTSAVKSQKPEPWTFILEDFESQEENHARFLADRIEELVTSNEVLPSTGRLIEAKDILVLVRKRSAVLHYLDRFLKQKNILTSGADQVDLNSSLVILDLLALAQFVHLPGDDYTLACILKSPWINEGRGISEQELLDLCWDRPASLWEQLCEKAPEKEVYQKAQTFLQYCLELSAQETPLGFFTFLKIDVLPYFEARMGQEARDLWNEFLGILAKYENENPFSYVGFVEWFRKTPLILKRSPTSNGVRFMTVHGSKGLQAPIVILADATEEPSLRQDLFLEDGGFWCLRPTQEENTPFFQSLKDKMLARAQEENERLLYVALTRAQDCLYITGLEKRNEGGWYTRCREALKFLDAQDLYEQGFFKRQERIVTPVIPQEVPSWYAPFQGLKVQERPVRSDTQKRGQLIHGLLHQGSFLKSPSLEQLRSLEPSPLVSDEELKKLLRIFERYSWMFGQGSYGERSIVTAKGILRPDRFLVKEKKIWIVDYKTSLIRDYEALRGQLSLYKEALQPLYPGMKIIGAVLWFEEGELEEVG